MRAITNPDNCITRVWFDSCLARGARVRGARERARILSGHQRLERDTRRLALATRDGRGKPESARPERLYIDRAIPSIAERLSQAPDRLSEAVLGHGRVSPGRFDERLLRDDVANVGDELDQNRGLCLRQWDAPASAKQAAARGIELEGPETVHHNAAGHDE